jgi:hypothetical protein
MSAFHTGIHQRYVMKVDPAAASLRGQHTEQNTITEYMIFEFTAYTATIFDSSPAPPLHPCSPASTLLNSSQPSPASPLLARFTPAHPPHPPHPPHPCSSASPLLVRFDCSQLSTSLRHISPPRNPRVPKACSVLSPTGKKRLGLCVREVPHMEKN